MVETGEGYYTVGVPWGYVLMTFHEQRRVKRGLVNG